MKNESFELSGQIVDVVSQRIYPGKLIVQFGVIQEIIPIEKAEERYIFPGLIDAHIHIESSMMVPGRFAELALRHGTVATVSDPHEIANVLGIPGIEFMVEDGKKAPFKFFFGVPSCVPATSFETSGAGISASEVEKLIKRPEFLYLSEMMNYPGVIFGDTEVISKIQAAVKAEKPVDGHIPGVGGEWLEKYVAAGISTDHECFSIEEAIEKIHLGMKILIREGSAAKNFDALYPLIEQFPDKVMLCSDDRHPDDLVVGHMNLLIDRGISYGISFFKLLRAATLNPIKHYGLNVGCLQVGDSADFFVSTTLSPLNIQETYVNGRKVYANGVSSWEYIPTIPLNKFNAVPIKSSDLKVKAEPGRKLKVIEALDGELITNKFLWDANAHEGFVESSTEEDILKIVLLNRYHASTPVVGFIRNFGLKYGAVASSIAHDSHNILAVGANDESIVIAMNEVISNRGGISVFDGELPFNLSLPVGGIMSFESGEKLAGDYLILQAKLKEMGSTLKAPLMTLSFMALLVIPELKIGDKGLFDGQKFELCSLFE